MKLITANGLYAREEQIEMEGNPIRMPQMQSFIERSGALWCVRGHGVDKNFGCYNSKAEAQAKLRTLHAGGPGSGCNPEVAKCGRPGEENAPAIEYEHDDTKMTPFMRLTLDDHSFPYLFNNDNTTWAWSSDKSKLSIQVKDDTVGGLEHKEIYEVPAKRVKEWQHATQQRPDANYAMQSAGLKEFKIKAVSQYGQTGWKYGRAVSRDTGFVPQRTLSGFPAARRGGGKVLQSHPLGHTTAAPKRGTGYGMKPLRPARPMKSPSFGHVPKIHVPSMPSSPMGRSPKASPMGRAPQLHGFADYGEPMSGAMGHAHIDPVTWFRPPSLTKREKSNEDGRIPADNPGENNDKFLDKTKRNSKDTWEQRMKLLKRSAPGGLPPQIPARTTLVEPHSSYLPSAMYAGRMLRRKSSRGKMFTSYERRGCI